MTDREINYWLMDMDGVLIREEQPLEGLPSSSPSCASSRSRSWSSPTARSTRGVTWPPASLVRASTSARTRSGPRPWPAIRRINAGARFIATNPDNIGPAPGGPLPATGSVAALISRASGVDPYFVGKPNPLMMRSALNAIDAHSEQTAMVGDRMDTDIVSGIEAGLETFLVLTGVTDRSEAESYPYLPHHIIDSVSDLIPKLPGIA